MIRIIEHSLIHTTGLTHAPVDISFPRLTPSDHRGGTPQLSPIAFLDKPKYYVPNTLCFAQQGTIC